LKEVYPEDKIHIIPFPCKVWPDFDQKKERRKLSLSPDKKIIFVFGQKWRNMLDTVPTLLDINEEYPLLLLTFSAAQRVSGFEHLKKKVRIRKEVLEQDRIGRKICVVYSKKMRGIRFAEKRQRNMRRKTHLRK